MPLQGPTDDELARIAVDAAVEVHRVLGGPGLLEKVYEEALRHELGLRGLRVEKQVPVPIVYKRRTLATPLYIDLLIEGRLVLEVKATAQPHPVFMSQVLTYLRLSNLHLGLLLNFGGVLMRDGIRRVVNGY